MREGSLEAPTRHVIDWKNADYYDDVKIEKALFDAFDICHGCRRCFNLCDSFPILFDLIDESESGELDSVDSKRYTDVVDACTLCDMCFMTKCPYVPPHEFDLDFPHLMLRAKASAFKKGQVGMVDKVMAQTDCNGKMAAIAAPLVNAATKSGSLLRPLVEAVSGIDRRADLPAYSTDPLVGSATIPKCNVRAPAFGRKAALFVTCFSNYNDQKAARAALTVLAKNGVDLSLAHPGCCGMPKLEHGDLEGVARQAVYVAEAFVEAIDQGRSIIAMTPSCALMMKFEWPLLLPDNQEVARLAESCYDLSEYIVDIAKTEGIAEGLKPLGGDIAMHLACHSRAQNMGAKAAEMLHLIPESKVLVIERCSGHGGKWGFFKQNYDTAMKVGAPVAAAITKAAPDFTVSECPLAGPHIRQMLAEGSESSVSQAVGHPIELLAESYNME